MTARVPAERFPDADIPGLSKNRAGIWASGVTVTYRNGFTALRDAGFAAPTGSITALVGVNGGGKSTLFKSLMGFVRPARGEIRILGRTVREALKARLVAYVPQADEVDWSFPVLVEDVVMMGRYGHMGFLRIPRDEDRRAVDTALARVGMNDFRLRQIGELSGGQKKRVFLARALAQDGQVLLLDEPFTGVDVGTEQAIIALLGDLRDEGRVILVATHDLGSVPEFCDRTVLVKGTVLASGPTTEVFTPENLERTFGGVLRRLNLGGAGEGHHILSDDERPVVFPGHAAQEPSALDQTVRGPAAPHPAAQGLAAQGGAMRVGAAPDPAAHNPTSGTAAPRDPAGAGGAGTAFRAVPARAATEREAPAPEASGERGAAATDRTTTEPADAAPGGVSGRGARGAAE